MKNIVFILIISVFIVSCSGRKKRETGKNQSEIKTFLALDKSNSINSVLDIFDLEKIVELETDNHNLIGNAKRVKIAGDNIFIYDNIRGTIYRFEQRRKFFKLLSEKEEEGLVNM